MVTVEGCLLVFNALGKPYHATSTTIFLGTLFFHFCTVTTLTGLQFFWVFTSLYSSHNIIILLQSTHNPTHVRPLSIHVLSSNLKTVSSLILNCPVKFVQLRILQPTLQVN